MISRCRSQNAQMKEYRAAHSPGFLPHGRRRGKRGRSGDYVQRPQTAGWHRKSVDRGWCWGSPPSRPRPFFSPPPRQIKGQPPTCLEDSESWEMEEELKYSRKKDEIISPKKKKYGRKNSKMKANGTIAKTRPVQACWIPRIPYSVLHVF